MTGILYHAPALLVVVPLLAAPLAVLARKGAIAHVFAAAASWFSFFLAVMLVQTTVSNNTSITYEMGGWAAPIGIVYTIDPLSSFMALIVTMIGGVVMLYAPRSVAREIPADRHALFYAVMMLAQTGLLGMAVTGDAFNVFVFLEISSLATYVLIGLGSDRRALSAAFQYLILGAIGGTFVLIGIGLMYMMTGTLNMVDLAERLNTQHHWATGVIMLHTKPVLVSFAFITVGLSLKFALFPLHRWLPNAYTYAPSVVSSFVSATATKVMVYVMLRFFLDVYGYKFAFEELNLSLPFSILALIGVFAASLTACYQENVKRVLAYSSVAQIGYIVLGISLATATGLTGAIAHLFNHALIKGGMFMAVGCMFYQVGSVRLTRLRGVGRAMPLTSLAFVLGGLGLIGVPGTAGFISKWYLVTGALDAGLWPIAAAALGASVIAVVYVWRVIEVAYLKEPSEEMLAVKEAPLTMLIPTWMLIGASIWFGFAGAVPTTVAQSAANMLLGVAG